MCTYWIVMNETETWTVNSQMLIGSIAAIIKI